MDSSIETYPLNRTVSSESVGSTKSASHYLSSATPSSHSNRKGRSLVPDRSNVHAERGSISVPPTASLKTSFQQHRPQNSTESAGSTCSGVSDFPLGSGKSNETAAPKEAQPGNVDNSYFPIVSRRQHRGSNGSIAPPVIMPSNPAPTTERHRVSTSSSLQSLGSVLMNHAKSSQASTASSRTGSEQGRDASKLEGASEGATTATTPVSVTTRGQSGISGSTSSHVLSSQDTPRLSDQSAAQSQISFQEPIQNPASSGKGSQQVVGSRPSRSRAPTSRRTSAIGIRGVSSSSEKTRPMSLDGRDAASDSPYFGIIGVCALDSKARSRPCRNILNRINGNEEFDVIIFGDKIILDEEPANWPLCDFLISFFSDGFPLDKAIEYVRLRRPFCVNDLPMQMVLWDRRICLQILDRFDVPTPKRVEVTRDGGPRLKSPEIAVHVYERTGLRLSGPPDGTGGGLSPPKDVHMVDEDTISVDGMLLKKPFVEKPVNGEDHNIFIYYAKEVGGGGRRLFRKVNNKSSEADPTLSLPRSISDTSSSYIYEAFLDTQNHEDVKAYTVGLEYCHAETRKSPVLDGIVKRNTHGKEVRYVTSLSAEETRIAARIAEAFGQRVCGFDLLRAGNKSYVIDVNGWSFVKDNNDYYDRCAGILKGLFINERRKRDGLLSLASIEVKPDTEENQTTKTSSGPFHTIKSMIKSPSMSLLAAAGHHSKAAAKSSPDMSLNSVPLTSPPSIERVSDGRISSQLDLLPPPAAPGLTSNISSQPSLISSDTTPQVVPPPAAQAQWKLKGMVAVIRHADRTPKQKFKFTFHTKPFIGLLKGHSEEVLLVGEAALNGVMEAVKQAMMEGVEDLEKLKLLRTTLMKKGAWTGTKVQIKPMFRSKKKDLTKGGASLHGSATGAQSVDRKLQGGPEAEKPTDLNPPEVPQVRQNSLTGVTMSRATAAEDNLELEKLQLIVKWGGEPTHSARYQSQELGENMRNDLILMNRDVLEDVHVFSSSERRVTTSAAIYAAAFLGENELPANFVQIRKDLLDDSNAAKDEMDKVKKKLKGLLREGNQAPPQFAWPTDMPEPSVVARNVVELLKFHRRVMRENYTKLYGGAAALSLAAVGKSASSSGSPSPVSHGSLYQVQNVNNIQSRWCCGEDPELFRERWEKLFGDICDQDKLDPGKISELHDTIKFDALHQRQFLEWVFTPSQSTLEEFYPSVSSSRNSFSENGEPVKKVHLPRSDTSSSSKGSSSGRQRSEKSNIAERMGFRKRSEIDPATLTTSASDPATASYFSLFGGDARSKAKTDKRLEKLRELFLYSKILFDFIGPQEYGITDSEKLEIGLLTSLPLLKAIVSDLEEMQASAGSKTCIYFTKESHIYTLLNCIIEGGIKTKIQRNKIPELDYLSTICFELYESQNPTSDDEQDSFNYSIRITISPGCHTFEPLDVQLDSRHTIGFAQRRSLTAHNDWKEVIETLRAKFNTVKLPKSFIAINLSEKASQTADDPLDLQPQPAEDSPKTIQQDKAAAEQGGAVAEPTSKDGTMEIP